MEVPGLGRSRQSRDYFKNSQSIYSTSWPIRTVPWTAFIKVRPPPWNFGIDLSWPEPPQKFTVILVKYPLWAARVAKKTTQKCGLFVPNQPTCVAKSAFLGQTYLYRKTPTKMVPSVYQYWYQYWRVLCTGTGTGTRAPRLDLSKFRSDCTVPVICI